MIVGIGNDHSALELKAEIIEFLTENGHEVIDYGTHSAESCDYPIYGETMANAVVKGEVDRGILICGTGIGISMAANKIDGIRAALCADYYAAKYTRLHNDANVICLGGRTLGPGSACELVEVFLNTAFEGGRHQRRVDKVMALEQE